ncbi:IclR family transcriptional regulator [Roseibium polysiphoniae]|uniref:IclR family transcriptional regulator n=1 Tax=Roseibium polysiphoniae TaxID=2571221 RepID=A0A944GVQ9_9HYPH|nr:IclR family transcriptional regulator C-terminal domain-containing protein [Roseibium polysiphoniae]MBS8262765.1 IclR family transcriptional regulator [Roseibium polysiphoniae]
MTANDMERKIQDRDISLTFAKGMSVLKAFDTSSTHLTLPQIARTTGLDRATTRRLVLTLVHLGYVKQEDRVFSLTPRILVLAGGFLQGRQFGKTIEPVIRSFSNQISEPISMAMVDGDQAVYVAHAGARANSVSIGFTVGSKLSLLSSAIGRALVAGYPDGEAEKLIAAAPLVPFTNATSMDRDAIAADITATAQRGYAYVVGEFEAGVAAVAVPVRPDNAEPSAIGVSGDASRFEDPKVRQNIIETLRECAKVVAELL